LKNRDNFLELIKLMSIYNEDVAKVVLENATRNAKYTSRHVQKDILYVLAKRVQNAIREEIDNSKFCIIIDEARDEFKRKQNGYYFLDLLQKMVSYENISLILFMLKIHHINFKR
jgi:Ulp1 family protease